jgi:hypothetical protein
MVPHSRGEAGCVLCMLWLCGIHNVSVFQEGGSTPQCITHRQWVSDCVGGTSHPKAHIGGGQPWQRQPTQQPPPTPPPPHPPTLHTQRNSAARLHVLGARWCGAPGGKRSPDRPLLHMYV